VLRLSLVVSALATILAALAGVPAGVALALGRFRGRGAIQTLVNTGMGLPPVVVGLVLTIFLWRTGPLGFLGLLYTPSAMVLAQFIVAAPIAAGFTQAAIELLEPDLIAALPRLRRYARVLTGDLNRADDLVQDTLVRALRSERLFIGGDVRSWLYTILTNLNKNRRRSLARRPQFIPLLENNPDASGTEAESRDIARALATLVEEQREGKVEDEAIAAKVDQALKRLEAAL